MRSSAARAKADHKSNTTPFAPGDNVIVTGAGGEWHGKITARRLPDGRVTIHPQFDDTAIYAISDDTGVSMPVSVQQISKRAGR